jgi:hypothetical protein
VIESFTLVGGAIGPLGISHAEVQPAMYLKSSIAEHLTL